MPTPRRKTIIAAAAVLLIAVIAGFQAFRKTASVPNDGDAVLEPGRRHQETRKATDRLPPPDKKTAARLLELERLKRRWLEAYAQDERQVLRPEIQALATESTESLLCSRDLLRLLEYLDGNGMTGFADAIRRRVPALFASDLAPEARKLLADLSHQPAYGDMLENWSYYAALSVSKEEFEAFRTSSGNEEFAMAASLGWNVQLAKSNPVEAMTSTLQLLDSGVNSYASHQVLLRLIDNIPSEATMAEIESLLPPLNSETSSHEIEEGRSRLLVKWAGLDPAAAANFVMENPERADPNAIERITLTVLETNYHGGLEWIEYFPPGPYLDAAARAAVMQTYQARPEVAQRYASMIGNEALREQSIREIENVLAARGLPPKMEGEP